MNKGDLRKEIIQKRNGMAYVEREHQSKIAMNMLLSSELYQTIQTIMIFVSFGSEIDTRGLIKTIISDGKRVYVPYCHDKSNKMDAVLIENFEGDLIEGKHGILTHKNPIIPMAKDSIDVVITPGLGFNDYGYRIGYGGGYYDRYLMEYNGISIGYGYDWQFGVNFNNETHDIAVNMNIWKNNVKYEKIQ